MFIFINVLDVYKFTKQAVLYSCLGKNHCLLTTFEIEENQQQHTFNLVSKFSMKIPKKGELDNIYCGFMKDPLSI